MTLSAETQCSLTYTDAVLLTNGGLSCEHQHLIDASGVVLKTSKEKGSVVLQRFIQQSNQNNPDETKEVWKRLDRTLTEAGLNEDLITELELTVALYGLSEDTAPDYVKY